jgi:hypothetical protein
MHDLKLKQQVIDTLKEHGFEIAGDGRSVRVAGQMNVAVVQHGTDPELVFFSIILPNGVALSSQQMHWQDLLDTIYDEMPGIEELDWLERIYSAPRADTEEA